MKSRKHPPTVDSAEARRYEDAAIERLKAKAFRITMPRVQVIRVLGQSTEALSAYQIHERILASGGRIDVVSVYRILATLSEIGLVHRVGVVDGYLAVRMERADPNHSLHVVCPDSGEVREIEMPDEALSAIREALRREGFQADSARIEVLGRLV